MGSPSKSCRLILYRFIATILVIAGVILCIVGLSTSSLFVSLQKGNDNSNAELRRVDIFFGLFISKFRMHDRDGTMRYSSFSTFFSEMDATKFLAAQILCVFATLAALSAVILHILVVVASVSRKWHILLIELILHLFIVAFLVAGIALVETYLYFLNLYGDMFLLKLLRNHDLYRHTGGSLDSSFKGPLYTYWVFVAADFCFLFAFLSCLPEFIVLVDAKRKRDRERKHPNLKKPVYL